MAAMTLANLRQLARGQYGLEYSITEDQLFIDSFLNKLINKAHHQFAAMSECYYNPSVALLAQSAPAANVPAVYTLGTTVIRADERTFQWKLSAGAASTWARLPHRHHYSLLEQHGPFEALLQGTPTGFYLHAGAADGAGRRVTLVPSPSASFDLMFSAWVYPAEMTVDGDMPELQDAEVYRLVSWICWEMAQFERSRGRTDAPVEMFAEKAIREAVELQRIIRYGTREFTRTAPVGSSPIEEAMERRTPNLGIGSRGGG
jgi:hypothetical protein